MRVVFFGTPSIAASILKFLHAHSINIVACVSKPDKPQGRSKALQPTAVKVASLQLGLPLLQPERASDPEFAEVLKSLKPDLIVVVAYGEIVKQHILDLPSLGCINVHASLLPEYRGAAPMQRALIDGKTETGVTIMHMVKKMDAGEIIRQAKIPIPLTMDLEELKKKMIEEGSNLLLEVLQDFLKGIIPKSTPQEESKVTLAPKVEVSECKLDFNQPVLKLHNLVRGVSPEPGAYFMARIRGSSVMVKVYKSFPIQEKSDTTGIISVLSKRRLLVSCPDGFLEILELQTAGKKRMDAASWIAGMPKEGIEVDFPF